MKILIRLFKWHLQIIYFFLKLLKTNNKKILLMSRQYNIKSLDFTLIEKDIHTSGHASEELIEKVKEIVEPKEVFTIHTESKGRKEE